MKRLVLLALVLAGSGGIAAFRQQPQQQPAATKPTHAPPGFEVQLVYHIPLATQGSWVSLAVGPNGDFYASDQNAAGVYRIRVGGTRDKPDATVTKVPVDVTGFQGMVWAFNSLYGDKNAAGPEAGIYRMRDTNNDGELDSVEHLPLGMTGGGEHGMHDVLVTEDGKGLYTVNGNDTNIGNVDTTTILQPWLEDEVTPRQPDARGHMRGRTLIGHPGSTTIRINPEGTNKKLVSCCYRNTYSAALNTQGELIGYDSDLEYDMASPWYRPTRITHIVSGSDFGWRNGTGKLPPYTEGTLPPVVEIGPGSPTGVISGKGAKFPAKYQNAMFALDWTYSTVFAIHLHPKGSSYTGEKEEFVFGEPFQVTDAAIGADGYMYVLTGGRGGQGDLWRVVYKGNESIASAPAEDNPQAKAARALRHSLEQFHGRRDARAVAAAWPHLSSSDVFLRNAARVAIESQPASTWAQRALTEKNPQARITAIYALARADSTASRAAALRSLNELDASKLTAEQKLSLTRAYGVVFLRLGDPTDAERAQVTAKLNAMLPDPDSRVNLEVVRDLVYLRDPQVTAKAVAFMLKAPSVAPEFWIRTRMMRSERYGAFPLAILNNPPPTEGLGYSWILRNQREGWTPELARQFFEFINKAQTFTGGASYAGHLADTKAEALRNMPASLRPALASLVGRTFKDAPDFAVTPPRGPGQQWAIRQALQTVQPRLSGRSYESGRNLFFSAGCAACHRAGEYGSDLGPDLTTNPDRSVTAQRILEKLINPDSIVEEQFKAREVRLSDGRTVVGLPIYTGNQVTIRPRDVKQAPVTVPSSQVASVRKLSISSMPPGLANGLNEEELADLVAYTQAGGNRQHAIYTNPASLQPARGGGAGGGAAGGAGAGGGAGGGAPRPPTP
jgi:putative heme-binding domain-containing protein